MRITSTKYRFFSGFVAKETSTEVSFTELDDLFGLRPWRVLRLVSQDSPEFWRISKDLIL